MKITKCLSIFLLLTLLFGACFNPPEISVTPHIEYEDVIFKVTTDVTQADSLIIIINFKDGDGDLGFDPTNYEHSSYPFNEVNYFLENNGSLVPVGTYIRDPSLPPFILLSNSQNGKLATVRTRKKAGYENLPAYVFPASCLNYRYDSLYIREEDKRIFDNTYNLKKILKNGTYVLLDTFYYETNPNHFNIDVDFLLKSPSDPNADSEGFVIYDWKVAQGVAAQNKCADNFYARFPLLSDNERPLEGTLRYAMKSSGFLPLFGSRRMKLQVTIRDRALHTSNTIRTKEFALSEIKKTS